MPRFQPWYVGLTVVHHQLFLTELNLQETSVATDASSRSRAEIVCIPYAFLPGLDMSSRAYHRAVQITSGAKGVSFSIPATDESKCSLTSSPVATVLTRLFFRWSRR